MMKRVFIIIMLCLLLSSFSSAYIVELRQKINVDFVGPNEFVLTNDEGVEQRYSWSNGTTPSDDEWEYIVYKNVSRGDICPDSTELQGDIKDSYNAMIDVLSETQKVYSDQKELSTSLTTCKAGLSECNALRERYLDESNKNVADATEAKKNLDSCEEEKNTLELRASRVTTLDKENVDLKKDVEDAKNKKNVWTIIGIILGALAFYAYQKFGGQIGGERPSDEGGF